LGKRCFRDARPFEPVECDSSRVGQLFSNLLRNALVYGAPDAPIEVQARTSDGWFELSVANTGDPIDPAALVRLFQPFFRGKPSVARDGLGLGPYICAEVAKAHGGRMDVKSDEHGTCFTLRMPTKSQEAGTEPARSQASAG